MREIDKTYLSLDKATARGLVHRDYIAHCLRWTHMLKVCGKQSRKVTVVDVGCGKEAPLAKTLYTAKYSPQLFINVDAGQIKPLESMKKRDEYTWWPSTEFTKEVAEDAMEMIEDNTSDGPIFITSFEVLEHMHPKKCAKTVAAIAEMVHHFNDWTDRPCEAYISTPCYNGKAANNHINEITYEAMGSLFERHGLSILDHWGTFASQKDYKHMLMPAEKGIYDRLSKYYDSNLVSILFAPLYPHLARNAIWRLGTADIDPGNYEAPHPDSYVAQFPQLAQCAEPWTSSDDWRDLQEIS